MNPNDYEVRQLLEGTHGTMWLMSIQRQSQGLVEATICPIFDTGVCEGVGATPQAALASALESWKKAKEGK